MKTALIIPARYNSTRFPGKPLTMIAGQTMLARVVTIARTAAKADPTIRVVVATDDARIAAHAAELNVACIQTSIAFATGTDRVRHATNALAQDGFAADIVINLQGDAPLTPPDFIRALIDSFAAAPCDVLTPVTRLSWAQLDALRDHKTQTPFSGTTVVFNAETGLAYWFSKNILPAIRQETSLRESSDLSPVWRHVGLYGYSRAALNRIGDLPESAYEKLEGLEQLRMLENGLAIRCVPVSYGTRPDMTGVDSPEDAARAEALILADKERNA